MVRRPAIDEAELRSAAATVAEALGAGSAPDPVQLKLVVKELGLLLATRYPGRTVEVRIPPYTAVQCVEGPRHTRGTPPNVVETDPGSWVLLCTGRATWTELLAAGAVRASGERSDLSALMPLVG